MKNPLFINMIKIVTDLNFKIDRVIPPLAFLYSNKNTETLLTPEIYFGTFLSVGI